MLLIDLINDLDFVGGDELLTYALPAVAGTTDLFAQDKPLNERRYDFQDISPRELIQRRHLPNVELITQDNRKAVEHTASALRL